MELPSERLEQTVFKMRPKNEEHMLTFMNKATHEEHLSQPLQTNNEQYKTAVTFITGFYGYVNVTSKTNKLYFAI